MEQVFAAIFETLSEYVEDRYGRRAALALCLTALTIPVVLIGAAASYCLK